MDQKKPHVYRIYGSSSILSARSRATNFWMSVVAFTEAAGQHRHRRQVPDDAYVALTGSAMRAADGGNLENISIIGNTGNTRLCDNPPF
jgi:hypothetical protein